MDAPVQMFGLFPAFPGFFGQTPNFSFIAHAPKISDGDEISTEDEGVRSQEANGPSFRPFYYD
jgi:hypothetical protein